MYNAILFSYNNEDFTILHAIYFSFEQNINFKNNFQKYCFQKIILKKPFTYLAQAHTLYVFIITEQISNILSIYE